MYFWNTTVIGFVVVHDDVYYCCGVLSGLVSGSVLMKMGGCRYHDNTCIKTKINLLMLIVLVLKRICTVYKNGESVSGLGPMYDTIS